MRIIGGTARGRRLVAPRGSATRPTAERVREAVFNVLIHGAPAVDFAATSVLDLFAGAGGFGLEALSRGARHATFIDRDREAIQCIRRNLGALGRTHDAFVLQMDAVRLGPPPRQAHAPFAVAFLDPPYGQDLAAPALMRLSPGGWLAAGAVCVVEVGADDTLAAPSGFEIIDDRRHGAARVVILVAHRGQPAAAGS